MSIKLFDPHGNILEHYEDENHILIESNENIQVSLTLELTEIKDDNETDNIEISNNVENNVENNVDSGTLIFKKRDNIGSTLYSESYKPNLESDRKMNKTNFSNLDIKSNFILNQNLNKLIKQSVNIIYVTHSIESILSKTNRVLLIKEGKIINDGSPYDLINTKTLSDLFNISIKVIEQEGYWRMLPLSH